MMIAFYSAFQGTQGHFTHRNKTEQEIIVAMFARMTALTKITGLGKQVGFYFVFHLIIVLLYLHYGYTL